MKIIYQDLLRFLTEKPSKESLSSKLFELGHEHEILGDIFDLELTPNRGDCLSLNGLARDLKFFFGHDDSIQYFEDDIEELNFKFQNLSPRDCPRITFLELEIEGDISEYKPYFKKYFSILGNKQTNFFTDVSNYISYELGQPTHCYESSSLNGKLIFERINKSTNFLTLLDSEIKLSGENCVFTIDGKVINLAGVMGGKTTSCSYETNKVIVECAFFNPESIIGKSIKYNLNSDAAHKFERGVDILSQEKVLRRFIKVVEDHVSIKNIKIKSFVDENFTNLSLEIDTNKINSILGTKLSEEEYLNFLKNLDFNISNVIQVPSHRNDIKSQNDLAEEIARLIGYNNISSKPIRLKLDKINNENASNISIIESFLTESGFNQVINFPFSKIKASTSISVDNPLDSNKSNLRLSLKESLIENLLYNERRQKDSIKLFEISNIYSNKTSTEQQTNLGLIISGRFGDNPSNFSKKLDYDFLNEIIIKLIPDDAYEIEEISRLDLESKKKDKIFYIEININKISDEFYIKNNINRKSISFVKYDPVSEYPSSIRDFSFLIEDESKVGEVIGLLEKISNEDIKKSFVFDFYNDQKNGYLKIGYRIIFQSSSKTLSDEEISKKVEKILKPIFSLGGVSIPGM